MKKIILITICSVLLGFICDPTIGTKKPSSKEKEYITVTILYDNYVFTKGLRSDWGFSCILKGTKKNILFDTGTKGELLLENIEKLKIDPKDVEMIVISHNHRDHTGGLLSFLKKNCDVSIYLPPSCSDSFVQKLKGTGARVLITDAPVEICEGVYLTGPMGERIIEQSMIVDTAEGAVVITGCAHPGILDIVRKSKIILPKDLHMVLGGFHLLRTSEVELNQIIREFRNLGVKKAGPTHCTGDRAIQMFKQAYGPDFVRMGVGRRIKIETTGMFGKQTNFEVATHSPLLIKVPGMAEPGVKTPNLVETVDLYPTLVNLCGLKKPNGLAGISLVPMLRDPKYNGKEFAFSFHPRGKLMGRTIRTDQYRLVYWTDKSGKEVQVELYGHQNDPDENINIAGNNKEIVQKLIKHLKKRSIE